MGCAASALDPTGIAAALAEADLSRPAFVMLVGEALVGDALAVALFELFEKVRKNQDSFDACNLFYGSRCFS